MAFSFIKFPKKFLESKEWQKPRKYSQTEALLYLLNESKPHSIGQLAEVWQWSKSTVHSFIKMAIEEGLIERLPNGLPNDYRTAKPQQDRELQQSAERLPNGLPNDYRTTPYCRDEDNPPKILSTTNVVSNIYSPLKGESESANIEFLKFQKWIQENAPRVAQMKEPFTEAQFLSLKTDFDAQFCCALLTDMHNYEPLLKKNRSANLTFRNWAKRRKQQDNEKPKPTTNQAGNAEPNELLRAVAEGIARSRTPQEWQS